MAVADDLNAAVAALTFNAVNNAPITGAILAQLQAVAAEMSPGAPLDELNDALAQLAWAAPNNAPISQHVIDELNDVSSQLTYGTETTNPDDLDAINQLTNAILAQEDWGALLWINWDLPSTTLTVQVRDLATLQMVCSASPWWTAWDNFNDAADDLIAGIYFQAIPVPPASTTMQACEIDPRSGPPWTGSGWIYAWNQTYAARAGQGVPVGHVNYMAAYIGVTQEASAQDVNLAIWPGIQPEGSNLPDGSICVLQPVLMRTPSSTRDKFNRLQWFMSSDINWTNSSGVASQRGSQYPVPIPMPTGVWAVIREYAGYWMMGFFKGNRGNTGPAFGKPYANTIYYASLSDPDYGSIVSHPFHYPVCVMEIPAPANTSYDCTQLNIVAVFGGVTINQGSVHLPVNWTHGQNIGATSFGINCGTKETIQNPTANGYTQLTLAYSASTLPPP